MFRFQNTGVLKQETGKVQFFEEIQKIFITKGKKFDLMNTRKKKKKKN